MTVKLEDTVYFHFGTTRADTGAATDADSLPTVTVEEDGVAMGYAPTVTNVTTGLYRVTLAATSANGFEATKRYSCYAVATVNSVTGRDGVFEFECVARSQDDLAYPATTGRSLAVSVAGAVDVADIAAGAITASEAPALANLDAAVSSRGTADPGDAMALTGAAVDAVLDEVVEGALTFREILRVFLAALALKSTGGGTANIAFRDLADSKNRIAVQVDANGNRLTITTLDGS